MPVTVDGFLHYYKGTTIDEEHQSTHENPRHFQRSLGFEPHQDTEHNPIKNAQGSNDDPEIAGN